MANANKVKFNIHNVHYALKTEDAYSEPVALPGAVSISLEAQGELTPFYADGIKYYTSSANGGYEGDLEVALIPDDFRVSILNETQDAKHVIIENANASTNEFALGFDVDGDQGSTRFWFYNCTASRPAVTAQTNEDTKEPQTETITISCAPGTDGTVRAKTTANTDEVTFSGWYTTVYQSTGAGVGG